MYTVLVSFRDLQDDGYRYHAGDEFPRPGVEVTDIRINELKTAANRLKKPLIKEVKAKADTKETEKPKRGKKKNAD